MEKIDLHGLTSYHLKKEVARSPLSTQLKYLVLESDPTPDYYARGNFPPNKRNREMHLFMPMKNNIIDFQEKVLIQTCILNNNNKTKLHINPGIMLYKKNEYQCLRIKETDLENLQLIADEFSKLGFVFFKDTKVNVYESSIFYKKYTEFVKLDEGIYQDKENEFRFFFSISEYVELDDFTNRINTIKNNCNYHMFDSFSSYLFYKDNMSNFVGIYSEDCDKERFGELGKYLEELFKKEC